MTRVLPPPVSAHQPRVAPGPRLPFLGRRVFSGTCSCGYKVQTHHAEAAHQALAEHRADIVRTGVPG
jgi:hypothetical protein